MDFQVPSYFSVASAGYRFEDVFIYSFSLFLFFYHFVIMGLMYGK